MLPYKMMSIRSQKHHKFIKFAVNIFSAVVIVTILSITAACSRREAARPSSQDALILLVTSSTPTPYITPSVPTSTPSSIATHTPTPTPIQIPTPTITSSVFNLCSPLEGVPISELEETISNPFHPPRFGSDEPHHGVDFAYLGPNRVALSGLPVLAAMSGRVAGVINDRFPYGNAVILETSLDQLDNELLALIPDLVPFPEYTAPLTCPPLEIDFEWDQEKRSLFLLYAHLLEAPSLEPGDYVFCGEPIGLVGDSGNALNPHLHLEMRMGPAGAQIPSMSHYYAGASPEEMSAYCMWRISGYFQMFDPMLFFRALWESP
jgi:murein DD-endopeptidase MepM/ murein hydrolase activator NlpD